MRGSSYFKGGNPKVKKKEEIPSEGTIGAESS